jgi:hypothetical protein
MLQPTIPGPDVLNRKRSFKEKQPHFFSTEKEPRDV